MGPYGVLLVLFLGRWGAGGAYERVYRRVSLGAAAGDAIAAPCLVRSGLRARRREQRGEV